MILTRKLFSKLELATKIPIVKVPTASKLPIFQKKYIDEFP